MTSSNPPYREEPNQFRPLTDASPGSARSPGRRVRRRLRRPPTTAYTLSSERKASRFFAKEQCEFTNSVLPTAGGIRVQLLRLDEEISQMGIPFTAPEGRGTLVWWTPLDTRSLERPGVCRIRL